METVSKYSLNPLATCFVPSSMKNQSVAVFPVLGYESSVNGLWVTKNGLLPIVGKQKTVTEYFGVTKGGQKVLSYPVRERTINEELVVPAMKVKEILSNTAKEEVSTTGQLTAKVHLTIREGTEKIPNKLDGKKISERRSKKRTGSKDTSLTEFDNAQPKQQILDEISQFLKRGTKIAKLLSMVWPFAIQSMLVMELFYRMRFNAISLDLTLCANLYSVFKSNRYTITYPKTSKKTKITKDKPKNNECHCPLMFGWIVPLEFFGNPLKLTEMCCKDYVHTTFVDGSSRQPPKSERCMSEDELSSADDETLTLEQCSSELKAIVKDVCDFLAQSYDQCSEESNETEVTKTRKCLVWEIETGKEVETKRLTPELIDDGFHPLLEISSVDTDDTDIASIQKLLGEAFSNHEVSSEQEILPSQSVCDLPCSVWCNKVPPSVKDTYKRFIKKLDSESTVHRHVTDNKRKVLKPLYKRFFSADDAPKSSDYHKTPLPSGSDFESRERLMLLRKDPIAFIKQSSTAASKDSYRKSRSNVSAISEQVATKNFSNENGCDKWSFYDGADSLWQPLPDCIPLSDSAQKHSHKKVRDMRRQKSVC